MYNRSIQLTPSSTLFVILFFGVYYVIVVCTSRSLDLSDSHLFVCMSATQKLASDCLLEVQEKIDFSEVTTNNYD